MLNTMNAGVSGLQSHGKALTATADNIANVSTMGFKASRANFGDLMVRSLTVGGSVVNQVGSGSRILNVQQMLLQGSFETTELPTDLAINGSGYFKVRNPVVVSSGTSSTNKNTGASYYTRAGQFIINKEGYLENPTGMRLQGYNVDARGNLSLIPEDLQLLTQQVDAIATTGIELTLNLDAEDENYHSPSEPVDPADSTTYNHIVPIRTYDALGVAHDVVMFYQRLEPDSYTGPQVEGTVRSWKVVVMEKVGDTYTQENLTPGFSGTFYLHFDDYGHLVGNTTGLPAAGDAWITSKSQPIGDAEISNRAGETFSYTTDNGTQTFRTSVSVNLDYFDQDGDVITINGTAYRYEDYTGTQTQRMAAMINDINKTAGNNGVFCNMSVVAGVPTLNVYTSGNTTAGVTVTNMGTDEMEVTGTTTNEMMAAINGTGDADLRTARGMIYVPSFPTSAGPPQPTITINGVDIPIGVCANITDVFNAIAPTATALGINLSVDPTGNYIYMEAAAAGADYNYTMSATSDFTCTPAMTGGLDAPVDNVYMQQDPVTGVITIKRLDQGVNATVTVAADNTIANGAFNMKQSSFAMDQEEPFSTNSDETGDHRKGVREISFSWLQATGAHQDQPMLIDFIPSVSSPTTQSAGVTETFYLDQDGAPRGSLDSIDIGRDGLIVGNFSNGTVKLLGCVLIYNFACPEELKREGENLWSSTMAAGSEIWGQPGQGGMGALQSGALEKSNVDLATEMVNMINFQRAFQANSKTIQTTDTLLQELINLKR